MKRLPLLGFATLAFGIVALAAETIRFEPALNTITKYRISTQSTAEILSSSLTTSDGLPAPAAFKDIFEATKAALSITQTLDMTEKVVAVEANGTRQLETTVTSSSQANTPAIGYLVRSSMTPNGSIKISSIQLDAATLAQPGMAEISNWFTEILSLSYTQLFPNIYEQPLDVGQTLKIVNTNTSNGYDFLKKLNPDAQVEVQGMQTTTEYTYQGRNNTNDHAFRVSSSITPGKFSIKSQGIGLTLEQTLTESRSEGKVTYFADGRIKSGQQNATQVLTQVQKINLQPQIITLSFSTRTNAVTSTEILP